jgi:hypothetical protein
MHAVPDYQARSPVLGSSEWMTGDSEKGPMPQSATDIPGYRAAEFVSPMSSAPNWRESTGVRWDRRYMESGKLFNSGARPKRPYQERCAKAPNQRPLPRHYGYRHAAFASGRFIILASAGQRGLVRSGLVKLWAAHTTTKGACCLMAFSYQFAAKSISERSR